MPKIVFIQCRTAVNKAAVTRETRNGIVHIIISSATLPDNIVMNGILYPADEIASSFFTLERTLAPVEHPVNAEGNFIPAGDPLAISNFYAGAFNQNVRQEGGRVLLDKVINVQEALKTDRGKRLLDRIDELENNESPRAIHTSVGVFIEVEELAEPQVNEAGDRYSAVARGMVFDHDAILLDSVGAAQPHQGVGIAVNRKGEKLDVQRYVLNQEDLVTIPTTDVDKLSHEALRDRLFEALNTPPLSANWIDEVFDDRVIYMMGDQFFSVPYEVGNGVVTISGIPVPVEREVRFVPKTNSKKRGDKMRELILAKLKEAGIQVKTDISDDDLVARYNEMLAKANEDDAGGGEASNTGKSGGETTSDPGEADPVVTALQPVLDRLTAIETTLSGNREQEKNKLVQQIVDSKLYPNLSKEALTKLDVVDLEKMVGNTQVSFGIPSVTPNNTNSDKQVFSYDMPA